MLRRIRFVPLLVLVLVSSTGAGPARAAFVESQVRARSEDDHDGIYHEQCNPSPSTDPEETCGCDPFASGGGGDEPDEKCSIDGDLFRFTTAPGVRVAAGSFACDIETCAFNGDPPDHGLGVAESNYGLNFVRVFAEDLSSDPWIYDAGGAISRWSDDLSFTSAVPDLSGATLRTIFRVRGSWQDQTCFVVQANTYAVPTSQGSPNDFVVFANGGGFPGATLCLMPGGSTGTPPGFTDYDAMDGTIDLAIPLEIPIAVPSTVRIFSELRAWANGDGAVLDGPNGGLEMTIERIEIPLGVDVTSAAGALAAYNVPEPGAAGGAAIALAALLALRRR